MAEKKKKDNHEEEAQEDLDWDEKKISPSLIKLVPYEAVKKYQFVPLEKDGRTLRVGVVNMDDIEMQSALQFLAEKDQLSIEMVSLPEEKFKKLLEAFTNSEQTISQALESFDTEEKMETVEEDIGTGSGVHEVVKDAPVAKIVEVVLRNAIDGSASDIHIEPLEEYIRVRYRLDGILHNSLTLPKKIGPAIVSRIKILSNLKIDERRKPQDGRFRVVEKGKQIDFRVSSLPVSMGETVVMRVLDKEQGLISLENLGIQGRNYDIIKESIAQPFGMILVSGPTGSGKSTTLYSILQILNKEGVNIITLEDPVEYAIEGLNQSQVKPDIGYTFAAGLRSILRQDPDIIMVGEIRDKETAELAVHAALTGHVVLSTIHTNDSLGSIPRLIDMGVEPFLIASSLRAIVAQRLVRRICEHCKEEIKPTEAAKKGIEKVLGQIPEDQKKKMNISSEAKMFRGKGCNKCGETGMKGRVGIYEVFYINEEVVSGIGTEVKEEELRAKAKAQGMITMKQDGILKVVQGFTTLEEVERVTEEETLEIE